MFSLEKFYKILYLNLLEPVKLGFLCFDKFGSTSVEDLSFYCTKDFSQNMSRMFITPFNRVLFYDQEPIYIKEASKIWGWNFMETLRIMSIKRKPNSTKETPN